MPLRPILVLGNPILGQAAQPVDHLDDALQALIDDMIETMRAAPGVGLAAPQVGVPLRLAVIEVHQQLVVLLNPTIVSREGAHRPNEGCLSVPGFWALLARAERVTVRALDRAWQPFELTADGLLAQAIQHEVDHLDGYLYIDRMPDLDALQRSVPRRKREVDLERELLKQETPDHDVQSG